MSLLAIRNRDESKLLGDVRCVRLCLFRTPSSFHVQMVEEDKVYEEMHEEMQSYYSTQSFIHFCEETKKLKHRETDEPFLDRLKIEELNVSFFLK